MCSRLLICSQGPGLSAISPLAISSLDRIFLVLILAPLLARTSAPLPAGLPPASPSRLALSRWWADESIVDTDCLLQQLLAVCAFDRRFGFG